jgi:integrase
MEAAKGNRWGSRDATMVLLAYRHGLRAAELVDLRWDQLDFETATLHVRRVKKGTPATHPVLGDELRALPNPNVSLDSLDVLEQTMRHFYIKAMVEKSLGEKADWKAVDAAMIQAAAMAEKVAVYRRAKLAAVRLAGELKKPTDGTSLDELLERIKAGLTKLGPLIDLEVTCEPRGRERRAGP